MCPYGDYLWNLTDKLNVRFISAEKTTSLTSTAVGVIITVLVSLGCHSKIPQTGWLKVTKTYRLTVLDSRNSKLHEQGHEPPETLGEVFVSS